MTTERLFVKAKRRSVPTVKDAPKPGVGAPTTDRRIAYIAEALVCDEKGRVGEHVRFMPLTNEGRT
jgi:hypothetical protein